jgi:hypothetical protein
MSEQEIRNYLIEKYGGEEEYERLRVFQEENICLP